MFRSLTSQTLRRAQYNYRGYVLVTVVVVVGGSVLTLVFY